MAQESNKDHWTREELEMLEKLFGLLSSDADGEVLAALRMVKKKLQAKKITWIQFTQRLARNAFGMVCSESSYSQQSSSRQKQGSGNPFDYGPFNDAFERMRKGFWEYQYQGNPGNNSDFYARTRRRGPEGAGKTESKPNAHKDPFDFSAEEAGASYGPGEDMDDDEKSAWNSGASNDGFSKDEEGLFQEWLVAQAPEIQASFRLGSPDWKSRVRRTWKKKYDLQKHQEKLKAQFEEKKKREQEAQAQRERDKLRESFLNRMRNHGEPNPFIQQAYNQRSAEEQARINKVLADLARGSADPTAQSETEEFLKKLRENAAYGIKVNQRIFKGGL